MLNARTTQYIGNIFKSINACFLVMTLNMSRSRIGANREEDVVVSEVQFVFVVLWQNLHDEHHHQRGRWARDNSQNAFLKVVLEVLHVEQARTTIKNMTRKRWTTLNEKTNVLAPRTAGVLAVAQHEVTTIWPKSLAKPHIMKFSSIHKAIHRRPHSNVILQTVDCHKIQHHVSLPAPFWPFQRHSNCPGSSSTKAAVQVIDTCTWSVACTVTISFEIVQTHSTHKRKRYMVKQGQTVAILSVVAASALLYFMTWGSTSAPVNTR